MKLFQAYYMHLLIFLSLTATSPAVAKYAKTGCNDTCGNVTIPYPFGIGADCAVNQWYIVDCNNAMPYLPALNHMEVLGVDLENQTVTVNTPNTPKISDCQNPFRNSSQTTSIDLGESPYVFSKRHSKFVFEGCGTAAMMDNGIAVTGCSTACGSLTLSHRNNCFGNGCCQTKVPYYLKSYIINLTGLEEEDGGCGSAFLVDQTLYDQGRFSFRNTSFIPISLLWTLPTDSNQVTCCGNRDPQKLQVPMFNSTPVDTWKCNFNSWPVLGNNPYLKDGCMDYGTSKYAKTGCKDTCGNNVTIPYPFGIGADCAVNEWYIVDCNNPTPYLSTLSRLEVLDVDLTNLTVTVSTPRITGCQNPVRNSSQMMSVDLGRSPFLFSIKHNKFVFEGCGIASMIVNGSEVTGCSTACFNDTTSDRNNNCLGIGCCQTTIPNYLKSYNISLTALETQDEDGGCASAFLVDETSYDQGGFKSFVPVSLFWTLTDSDPVTCCYGSNPRRSMWGMFNGTPVVTWVCPNYVSLEGNPYLINGCKYYDDEVPPDQECRRCLDSGGYCDRKTIYDIDGLVFSENFVCSHKKRTSLGVILGGSISMGVIFLVGASYVFYKWIKKTKEKR